MSGFWNTITLHRYIALYSVTCLNEEIFWLVLRECKRILGEEAFQKAYDYLKQARYLKTSSVDSEETIMQGLREFVKNPSDCFLVDQLLFLEEQAKIPFWCLNNGRKPVNFYLSLFYIGHAFVVTCEFCCFYKMLFEPSIKEPSKYWWPWTLTF